MAGAELTMVERVARQIDPSAFSTHDRGIHAVDLARYKRARTRVIAARRRARAAIAEMRQPMLYMAGEGYDHLRSLVGPESEDDLPGRDASRVYQTMIDAALNEPPQPAPAAAGV